MPDGTRVNRYTIGHGRGLRIKMITYGAAIQEILVPDRHGHIDDVVLGLRTLDQYRTESPYFGAPIGRYANRIAKGIFTLDGVTYHIPLNNGPNALHGGPEGFNTKVWNATEVYGEDSVGVRFLYFSPNGQMGFPGNLTAAVTYTVNTKNELSINYIATTDRPTIVNLTNHSYFNLRGEGQGDVYDHVVMLNADRNNRAVGIWGRVGRGIAVLPEVERRTREPHTIGARICDGVQQILFAHAYDHNWVLNRPRHGLGLAARVHDPETGRRLECWTDQVGIQFYSGNFLDGLLRRHLREAYQQGDAITLETQHFPDSANHKNFPSTVLRPGQEYNYSTVFKFSAR